MSDDTSKLLKACMEYRAMVNKLEAENAELREALSDDACREIMRLRSENAALRQALADMPTCRCGLSTDEQCALSVQNAALRKDKERLDSGTILLTVNGERVHHVRVDLRAAIDAARKEAQP